MQNYNELENNVNTLNLMFKISTMISQASDVYDLFLKIKLFINDNIKNINTTFYTFEDGSFKIVPLNEDEHSDEYFEYDNDNEALSSVLSSGNVIKTINEDNEKLFSAFINESGLKWLNIKYIRAFFEKNRPVCFCLISTNNSYVLTDDDLNFLNNLFNYIEPGIIKLIEAKNQEQKVTELLFYIIYLRQLTLLMT